MSKQKEQKIEDMFPKLDFSFMKKFKGQDELLKLYVAEYQGVKIYKEVRSSLVEGIMIGEPEISFFLDDNYDDFNDQEDVMRYIKNNKEVRSE
jgi:hypothetical protein